MGDSVVQFLIGLLLAAYGWIFKQNNDRLKAVEGKPEYDMTKVDNRLLKLEARPACRYTEIKERVDKVDMRLDKFEPHLIEIKTKLASIEETLVWLKRE